MNRDPRLESYLTSLERVLRPFPVSDRAEIVTEIKSHVLSALERDPQARLDSVLAALGEPETVANRYLLERGMQPAKPPISPIVRWVVIGFLGTIAMLLAFAAFIATRFMPLVQVDELTDRVSLLGGLVQVEGDEGRVFIHGTLLDDHKRSGKTFAGSIASVPGQPIAVKFRNGSIALENSSDGRLHWQCKARGSGTHKPPDALNENGEIKLDLSAPVGIKCELEVPAGARLSVDGGSGKLDVKEPRYDLNANLTNGKVEFDPEDGREYRYDMAVNNGSVDSFPSSASPSANSIKIHVTNGKINLEN